MRAGVGVVDKLLFGSDYPLWTPAEATQELRNLAGTAPAGLPPLRNETIEYLFDTDPRPALGLT